MELWYSEQESDWIRTSWAVDKTLFSGRSKFQKIDVLETRAYGTMLLLDGMVMLTDVDEFVYHEMISHIPVCLHASPKRIVVIGGGDGGTVRELLKHREIEQIVLCEIDELVIEKAREYFPSVAGCLDDPRVVVKVGDGVEFVKTLKAEIDVILVDSTDPIGPGEGLFSREFYSNVAKALKKDGIMVAQSESPWFKQEVLQRIHRNIAGGFSHIQAYVASIPTYPRGFWSWTVGSQMKINPSQFDRERFQRIAKGLHYLTEDLMIGAFAVPKFFKEKIDFS